LYCGGASRKNLIENISHFHKNKKVKGGEKMRKELDMKIRKAINRTISKRYKNSTKKEKGEILDEFTKITGYNRNYASYLLNRIGKKIVIFRNKERVVFIGDNKKFKKREKPVMYESE